MHVLHGNVPLQRRRPLRQALQARDAWLPLREGSPSTPTGPAEPAEPAPEPEPEVEADPLPLSGPSARMSLELDDDDVADATSSAFAELVASSREADPASDIAASAAA